MRWIDIDLRHCDETPNSSHLLERAAARSGDLCRLQAEHGFDSPFILRELEQIGQLLFKACQAHDPAVFSPEHKTGTTDPEILDLASRDASDGYHLILSDRHLALPWTCLHNGVGFLLEHHPICAARTGSQHPLEEGKTWARRREDVIFTGQALGPVRLDEIIDRMRPQGCAVPEILYLGAGDPGPDATALDRQGENLLKSLNASARGRLADMRLLNGSPTPGRVIKSGYRYQGFHFADNTMAPPAGGDGGFASEWLGVSDRDGVLADAMEAEVVGVDPITALLDDINERADSGLVSEAIAGRTAQALLERTACLRTQDGPVNPEDLGYHRATPPLVFSNTYCSLRELGERFLSAGASVFVGPQARIPVTRSGEFAQDYYFHLGSGVSAGEAFRLAALDMRDRTGRWDPVWLFYGMIGHGSLALQYL